MPVAARTLLWYLGNGVSEFSYHGKIGLNRASGGKGRPVLLWQPAKTAPGQSQRVSNCPWLGRAGTSDTNQGKGNKRGVLSWMGAASLALTL